jgi:hypothetical protein
LLFAFGGEHCILLWSCQSSIREKANRLFNSFRLSNCFSCAYSVNDCDSFLVTLCFSFVQVEILYNCGLEYLPLLPVPDLRPRASNRIVEPLERG